MSSAAHDEEVYVHQVYDSIASHFSDTRYKPWPLIANFLENCPSGSLGLDAGTGNGKYLGTRSVIAKASPEEPASSLMVGLDRSHNLLKIAKSRGHEVVQSDCSCMPWRRGIFDFCISIATIHHFTTPDRRKEAVKDLILAVTPQNGRVLIQVWALEQGEEDMLKRRKKLETAALSAASDQEQDVFVPWGSNVNPKKSEASTTPQPIIKRYYHLFKKEELKSLCLDAAKDLGLDQSVQVVDGGWERGNWWIQLIRKA